MRSHAHASAHAPITLETCEKKHSLFDSKSFEVCGRSNKVFYLSLSIKYKDLTRKLCVFIFYFIGSVVKIVCFYFLYIKDDELKKN